MMPLSTGRPFVGRLFFMVTQAKDQVQSSEELLPLDSGDVEIAEVAPAAEATEPAVSDAPIAEVPVVETTAAPAAPAQAPTEATAPTSPYEVPPELRVGIPTQTPQVLPEEVQRELEYLRGQQQDWGQVRQTQEMEQSVRQDFQRFQTAGYDDQTAQYMANIRRDALAEAQGKIQQEREGRQFQEQRQRAAEKVGREHNVHPADVADSYSPGDMIWKAKAINKIGDQNKTIAELTKRIEGLEKRSVPAQTFDGGVSNGATPVTADNIDQLYVGYGEAHPGEPNIFETRYREFLAR